MNSYDIDGVIYLGPDRMGVYPGPGDIIITGRSVEERPETLAMLHARGIFNPVHFNPLPFEQKTRVTSGQHKATIISSYGSSVKTHFEDDEVQAEVIRACCPWVTVVMVLHNLVEKENVRHSFP